jgi:hypothetical protein
MTKTEQETALAKARKSVAEHLAKGKELVAEHLDKMVKLHKANADAMTEHFGKMHKMLGVEEADSGEGANLGGTEPEAVDPTKKGTENERHVTGPVKTDASAELLKTVQAMQKQLNGLKENFDTQLEKGINEGLQVVLTEMSKADVKNEEEPVPCPECGNEKCSCDSKGKAKKAAGIGNRQDPVLFSSGPAIRVMPVTKNQDTLVFNNPTMPTAPTALTKAEIAEAINGQNPEAALRMMKSARVVGGLPATLESAGVAFK